MATAEELEARVVEQVARHWPAQVARLKREVLALHSTQGGALTTGAILALLARLDLPGPGADPVLLAGAVELGVARVPGTSRTPALDERAVESLRRVSEQPAEGLAEARRRLTVASVAELPSLLGALAPLSQSAARVEGTASYAVEAARNGAVRDAAAVVGVSLVFTPERDACVECTGYAGLVDDEIAKPPPVHPWCRCDLEPFENPDVPRILKREAVRSALRGFSLPSESKAARLRFARETLARRPVAPESVKRYARTSLRRGKFPRGRSVPPRR